MQVVVEGQLCTSLYITKSKEPNAHISIYSPFLGFTVWAAAVVHEPSGVSFWASINHTILCEGEHVEVGHMIFMRLFDSLLTLLRVNHFSNIFSHKVTISQGLIGS